MSLYDRLDLTRPDRKKRKQHHKLQVNDQKQVPIWERIDLTRPEKPKCQVCRQKIQSSWRVCPNCGWTLQQKQAKRHCIWVQVGNLEISAAQRKIWSGIIADAFCDFSRHCMLRRQCGLPQALLSEENFLRGTSIVPTTAV
ncbi:MAG: hypothetical protein AB4372_29140 [Xenococcus sp. (in: cyanobacteria)]